HRSNQTKPEARLGSVRTLASADDDSTLSGLRILVATSAEDGRTFGLAHRTPTAETRSITGFLEEESCEQQLSAISGLRLRSRSGPSRSRVQGRCLSGWKRAVSVTPIFMPCGATGPSSQ